MTPPSQPQPPGLTTLLPETHASFIIRGEATLGAKMLLPKC